MFEQVIVGETIAGEAEKTRKELEKLIGVYNSSTFDIGELLYRVKKNGFHKNYGFNTFLEFVSELDIKTRKAQYLVKITETMDELNIPRNEFEPVGIAKLREISSLDLYEDGDPAIYQDDEGETHLISDIIKGLIIKSHEMSLDELKKYVKIIKGFTGDNDLVWVNICLNRQAFEQTVQPALSLCKKALGTTGKNDEGVAQDYSDGKALEMICADYLLDPANSYLGGQNAA